ncbi:uncharacterized protein LOC114311650 [Camellia sinensis]|uniref:uncharacterized protein LOC114311650 n=1 Tax=Camellia sinensis TaxID=4442 RepID=UPI0010360CA5|nr:uncharacterized protein LOC114311650 [Camellia sinensis]
MFHLHLLHVLMMQVLRMVVSTYQAASGAGAAAMEELEQQTREVLEGKPQTCNIFNQQYAFDLFSHNAPILSNGYNEEEMKLVKENRKIWNDMNVKVTATCIRVPVMRAHAESANLQVENPLDEVILHFNSNFYWFLIHNKSCCLNYVLVEFLSLIFICC